MTTSSTASAAVVRLAVEVIVMLRGLPARAGVLPREALHLGEHIAHVFRVLAMLAGRDVLHRFWQRERGFVERGVHVFLPAGLQIRRQRTDAGSGDGLLNGVHAKKFAG